MVSDGGKFVRVSRLSWPIAALAGTAALCVTAFMVTPRYWAFPMGEKVYRLNLRTGALQSCDEARCVPVTIIIAG